MPGGADLHLHSRHSDGADEPERIVELAAQADLQALSLTDHDTVAGLEAAIQAGSRLGVRVVPGVELSAEFLGHEVHLLAYGFDREAPPLLTLLEACRKERETRTASMVERLNRLGIPMTWSQVEAIGRGASLGRPHLAEALLRARVVSSFQEAFDR
jgi:predicted metal-dependent phosphoesterase TrpH